MDDNRGADHNEPIQARANHPDAANATGAAEDSNHALANHAHNTVDSQEQTVDENEAFRRKIEAENAKLAQYQAQITAEGKADNWLNNELAKHLEVLDDTSKQVITYAASKSYGSLVEKAAELKKEIAKGYLKNKDYSHLELTSAQKSRIESASYEGYQELREAENQYNHKQAAKQLNSGLKSEAELKHMSSIDRAIYAAERRSLDNYKSRYNQALQSI